MSANSLTFFPQKVEPNLSLLENGWTLEVCFQRWECGRGDAVWLHKLSHKSEMASAFSFRDPREAAMLGRPCGEIREKWRKILKECLLFCSPAVGVFPGQMPDAWVNKPTDDTVPRLTSSAGDEWRVVSYSHCALIKLLICEQNRCYSKPVSFGEICHTFIFQ